MKEYLLKKVADVILARIAQNLAQSHSRLHASIEDLQTALNYHLRDVKNWSAEISFTDLRAPKATGDVFIPLDVLLSPRRTRLSVEEESALIPLDKIITDSSDNHLIILGQPGAGKTTSMKYICNQLLGDGANLKEVADFPILIRLRELNTRASSSDPNSRFADNDVLVSKLQEIFGIHIEYPKELSGDEYMSQRRVIRDRVVLEYVDSLQVLLILDGFDEIVSRSRRNAVIAELRIFAHQLENSRIIMTARTGEFNYHIESMDQFEISPLSNAQIFSFASRWLGKEDGQRLLSQISDSPFKDTAIRPLTMAHLCAIYERAKKIPDKPKTVYRKVVSLLLNEWDEQRSIQRESAYASFDVDRKFEFLCHLAFSLTTSLKGSTFSKDDLVRAYHRLHSNFGLPSSDAYKVANELESHTGLFVQAGYESFEFSHKSLQEYLTAEFIVRLPSIPISSKTLGIMPNELAIATAISSRPSEYFAQLVFERFNDSVFTFPFVRAFISRLLLERPDFDYTPRVGAALLGLYSKYIETTLRSANQLHLFVIDRLEDEFTQLVNLIRQRIKSSDILQIFEIREIPSTASGQDILKLEKRPVIDLRRMHLSKSLNLLFRELPEEVWIRRQFLEGFLAEGMPSISKIERRNNPH
jgi:NACHT domain-containing protein